MCLPHGCKFRFLSNYVEQDSVSESKKVADPQVASNKHPKKCRKVAHKFNINKAL